MKDAYSFDVDEKGAEESYQIMFNAYCRIFTRCGLQYSPVEADPGLIGGSFSHEFMVHAETGEETITICNECGYSANVELTPLFSHLEKPSFSEIEDGKTSLRKVHTPCITTAEEVADFFERNLSDITKTLVYSSDGLPIVVMVRGDYFINEIKLKNYLQSAELILAGEEMTQQVTNARVGFAGPINLRGNVRIVGDFSVMEQSNLVLGANEDDHHFDGATIGKDFEISEFADIRAAVEGDPCPKCKAPLRVMKGIEVGHVFKLGTKYSEAMGTRFLGEDGELRTVVMGCYGIGIGRTVAAAIEQNHDENGIIWPVPIAPYHVVVIPIKYDDPNTRKITENLYQTLNDNSIEVLLDDREERPGVKFKDADLMGIPFQVIVGPKGLVDGKVEFKARRGGSKDLIALTEAENFIQSKIQEEMSATSPERLGI
jgi:prolyl-tRNA synthetase